MGAHRVAAVLVGHLVCRLRRLHVRHAHSQLLLRAPTHMVRMKLGSTPVEDRIERPPTALTPSRTCTEDRRPLARSSDCSACCRDVSAWLCALHAACSPTHPTLESERVSAHALC
jgi:hypothetical protein